VRKGRIVYQEFFWDHAEALEAVGLSEQAASALETVGLTPALFGLINVIGPAREQTSRSLARRWASIAARWCC
jgi:hypothetical protein